MLKHKSQKNGAYDELKNVGYVFLMISPFVLIGEDAQNDLGLWTMIALFPALLLIVVWSMITKRAGFVAGVVLWLIIAILAVSLAIDTGSIRQYALGIAAVFIAGKFLVQAIRFKEAKHVGKH